MKRIVCIGCPKGCALSVDEDNAYAVSGNHCEKGAEYGKTECMDPRRTITSTICVTNGTQRRCSVKTSSPIPKKYMKQVMEAINSINREAPIAIGDRIADNLLGLEVSLVATSQVRHV